MKPPSTRPFLLHPESLAITDMVLNLFIFFFVSFSLLYTFSPERLAQLEVVLPKAKTGQGTRITSVVVTITRDGRVFLADKKVSRGNLSETFTNLTKKNPGVSVLVRADEAAPCRSLVEVFDAGRSAGVSRMNFAVKPAGNG
tara:strand:- start:507 stop:932 length:426 start_codon:yes stop_codon:yes gene_type:complete